MSLDEADRPAPPFVRPAPLGQREAAARLKRFGYNELEAQRRCAVSPRRLSGDARPRRLMGARDRLHATDVTGMSRAVVRHAFQGREPFGGEFRICAERPFEQSTDVICSLMGKLTFGRSVIWLESVSNALPVCREGVSFWLLVPKKEQLEMNRYFSPTRRPRLGFKQHGSGPEHILVMHDWLGDHTNYDPTLPYLDGARFTYAFVDLRGYGRSIHLTGAYTIDEIAADCISVADHLGWRRFHVVGHSMTGMATQRIAANAPSRIKSAIAVCPISAAGNQLTHEAAAFFCEYL